MSFLWLSEEALFFELSAAPSLEVTDNSKSLPLTNSLEEVGHDGGRLEESLLFSKQERRGMMGGGGCAGQEEKAWGWIR